MVSPLILVSSVGAFTAIIAGIIVSPLPKNLGFYRYLAAKKPELAGMTPAFHHGVEWQYTYEKLYNYCPQIKGQTALITGANSGVGFQTAKALAKCGVEVTMACRNPKKCASAAEEIREASEDNGYDNEVITMTVDTSSLESVKNFSQEFLAKNKEKALDMLYLNAGIVSGSAGSDELVLSEDGIEMVFATNYVGHHLMYKLLEPLLLKSKLARVIQTSSMASFDTFDHKVSTSIETLNSATKKDHMQIYGQSKLAQIIWTKHLTKLLGESSTIHVNACHPGAVDTFLWDKGEAMPSFVVDFVNYLRKNVMWTAEEGALTQLYLGVATDELVAKNIRGKYYHPQAQEVVNPLSLDEKLQKELWEFSDTLVAKFL